MKFPYKLIKAETLEALKAELKRLIDSNESATTFIKEIENGNLNVQFLGDKQSADGLGHALLSMQEQLQKIAADEKARNWATLGLAQFSEILRADTEHAASFYQKIIAHLVKYMEANQGGLFLVNDQEADKVEIELVSCYAYNRQKYINKSFLPGEGLVGQCFLEKDTIFLTDIPQNYISITSGLGNANPACVLIVPLKVNEVVHGFVELASFQVFKPYQVEFLEKLGESIASTISTVKINERTRILLDESQQQAEIMRAQEEEMRQNMEELSATQEDMHRTYREIQEKERYTHELINATNDLIFSLDKNFKVIDFNEQFRKSLESSGIKVEKGMDIFLVSSPAERPVHQLQYERSLRGETHEVEEYVEALNAYYLSYHSPLRNNSGEIYGVAVFVKDISDLKRAQKETEKLLQDAQNQAEEMKAQEEELRQNMEELHAIHEQQAEMQRDLAESEQELKKQVEALIEARAEIDDVRRIEQERANERMESQKKAAEKMMMKFRENEQKLQKELEALLEEVSVLKDNKRN